MKIGISLTSFHATRDVRAGARWMVERTVAAREAGLDSLFVGDHHVMPGPYYQNTAIMGRLLAEWGEAPAGCLFLLPLWNPVLLAEQVGTLASIAKGRFVMQCALGDGRPQFSGIGVNIKLRPSRFEDGLDIIRKLLAGEVVTKEGRFPVREARINPVPPEPVDVWIGGSAEPSIDRAASLGDAWLGGPELSPKLAKKWIDYYKERLAAHGRALTPGPSPAQAGEGRGAQVIAIRRDIFVGESDAHAAAVAEPIVKAGYRGFDPSACTYGSVETVAAKFREYGAMGYTDIIVRHLTDEQGLVLGSIGRLAEVRRAVSRS
jgi:alkanesulfonate monooxygenase SsuD/methylene tetrahydromethanopterin reductase-like flavin-dependent oxidoreductase (luciferase family)